MPPFLTALLLLVPVQDDPVTDDVPRTVVTARKVTERADRVPASVTAIDGAALDDARVRTVEEAVQRVPNLRLTEFSSRRLSFPYVRGIGSGQGEPAVVTYVDGVPQLTLGSSNLPLVGLERLEVLRGPQGTLYGRNALGGVMHLITRRPGSTAESFAGTTLGDHGLFELEAGYEGPVGEHGTGLSLSALYSERDGYTRNTVTGNDVDSREAFFGRAQVYMNPSDDSQLRVGVHAERARDGGFVLGPLPALRANPHQISQDHEGVAERDVLSPSVVYERWGDETTLTSITSLTDWDVLETSDFDFSAIDGIRRETIEDQTYLYQEVRLASAEDAALEVGDGVTLRWLAGASLFTSDSGRSAANDFRPGGAGILFPPSQVGVDTNRGSFDDTGIGVFGQLAFLFESGLELAAGLRYDREEKDADLNHTFVTGGFTAVDTSSSFSEDYDELVPSLSAAYHVGEHTTVYASAAGAFKAGGFNLSVPTNGQAAFGPEDATAYELGFKRRFDDGKVGVRLAAFLIDWEDMQLSLFDPMVGGYVANAGESESKGLELEVDARLTDHLDTFLSFGLVETEFDRYFDPVLMIDNSGNDLPFAPEQTIAIGAQYTEQLQEDLQLVLRGTWTSVGDFYYDAQNLGQESFELLDLRAGVRSGDWSFDVFARNLLDEEYFPIAFNLGPTFVAESGAPQTLGFSLRYSF